MTKSDFFRIACLACVLMAGSCAAPSDDPNIWADGAHNHPIDVDPTMRTMLVSYAGGIGPEDEARMDGFVQGYLAQGNGAIEISVPAGGDSQAAIQYFGQKLADLGVPAARIMVGTRAVADGDARVELGYIGFGASVSPCGDWSANYADTATNVPPPDFGCANQHNLAVEVADPRDLIRARGMTPADATRRTTVMGHYEKGEITQADKHMIDKQDEQRAAGSTVQ